MPRKNDPSKIKTGSGLTPSDSIESNAFVDSDPVMGGLASLEAHIKDPIDAHDASAISVDGIPTGIYDSDSVEGVLDELGALVPPRPPNLGKTKSYMAFSGVTDWGVMKLADSGLTERGILTPSLGNLDKDIYPYFNQPPKTAWAGEVAPLGADTQSDSVFNVDDGTYTGGGIGKTYSGGYKRGSNIVESFNLHHIGGSPSFSFVVSGSLFPADRGTLALFRIPIGAGGSPSLASIECIAALNCGQGILDGCDGETGGIWNYGVNNDVFDFPAAATGQYDLQELHTGLVRNSTKSIVSVKGPGLSVLIAALNHGLVGGDSVYITGTNSTPVVDGIWTVTSIYDENSFYVTVANAVTVDGGAAGTASKNLSPAAFNQANASSASGQVREKCTILGGTTSSVAPTSPYTDSRDDNNFFRYRLPYNETYISPLQWTPVSQQGRFFKKPTISLDAATDLTQAGNYDNFKKDYWTFQVARYRQRYTFPVGTPEQEQGCLLIMHFKKEEYFEDLLLSQVAPTADKLYSANLVNWGDVEADGNIFEIDFGVTKAADSYNILKSRVFEDDAAGITNPALSSATYTLKTTASPVPTMYVSGIQYFIPSAGLGTGLSLKDVTFTATGLWENTWRMGSSTEVSAEITPALTGADPAFLWMGSFGSQLQVKAATEGFPYGNGVFSRKAELKYSLLGSFSLTAAPLAGDNAVFANTNDYIIKGDDDSPRFCSDSRLRTCFRRPLLHGSMNYVTTGAFTEAAGKTLLVHSTSKVVYTDTANGTWQNWLKDEEERFLDEVYRWLEQSLPLGSITQAECDRINGPGLPTTGVIDVPVRIVTNTTWQGNSYIISTAYANTLTTTGSKAAQVAGLPDRNPPLSDGIVDPMPSRGILTYPQINYSAYRPSLTDGDIAANQHDYSGCSGDRVYIRAFDASFRQSSDPVPAATGASFFKLRVHGLKLSDFAWDGSSNVGGAGIAILVKLAGLTTWMDIGRQDGSGPSKQDAFSDGAGCQVIDPTETKEDRDPLTGIWYSDVLIHTGPSASLYDNGEDETPVMVKVILKDNATGKGLNFEQGGANGTTNDLRGLVGLELRRPE